MAPIYNNRVIIVMPAYYAEKTLELTYQNLPKIYDKVILCDDGSKDNTFELSKRLGITSIKHAENLGYGANQKTLYEQALKDNPEVIIMVHPDNQYDTGCIQEMIQLIRSKKADMVLGSRIKSAIQNKMPMYKFISNRFLTFIQNYFFKTRLSEFHSGLRAYRSEIFYSLPYKKFSNDFVFDSEMIAWLVANGYRIGEVDTNCYYNESVSSINLKRSIKYGLETLMVMIKYLFNYYKNT